MRLDECGDCLRVGFNHPFALDLSCLIDDADRCQLQRKSRHCSARLGRQKSARKRHSRNRHGAVILHGKFQPPVQAPQGNLCSACSSVACIAQSLLRDAKEAQRHVLRQCIGNVAGVHLQSNWTLREALALGFQRFDQAELFEDGGMEAIRKACMSSLSGASG